MAEVTVAPEVLRWARQTAGLSRDEAARRIQRPATTLRGWERGEGRPTVAALRELAAAYHRPLAAFLLAEPPPDPSTPADFRRQPDRGGEPLHPDTLLAIRKARTAQRLLGELELIANYTSPEPRLSHDTLTAVVTAERIRLDVTPARQATWRGGEGGAFVEWRRALDRIGVFTLQADMPRDDARGFSLVGDPPTVVVSERDQWVGKVFTLFHEYGHILIGQSGVCIPLGSDPSYRPTDDEHLCNLFAGAFLVPRSELLAHPQTWELESYDGPPPDHMFSPLTATFHVSKPVIWYRLLQEEVIGSEQFRSKWADWRWEEPSLDRRDDFRSPARWQKARWRFGNWTARRLVSAEERGQLSLDRMLRTLDVPLEDVPRLLED